MAITEQDETRAADARGRHRQDKKVPMLIRDDGMLYPNTPLVRRNPRFRPYHGDPRASLADRMRYLAGLGARRAVVFTEEPEAPFDLGKATVEELLVFAQDQFGVVLDPNKPVKALRQEVYRLSQLPDPALSLPPAQGMTAGGEVLPDPAADGLAEVIEPPMPSAAIDPPPLTRGGRQPRVEVKKAA